MRVSFIIPVRNDAQRLGRCLARIAACGLPSSSVEVIVVDNGSTDDSGAVARRAGAHVLVAPHGRVSHLRNVGAWAAVGDILAFVDADHEIAAGWASAAVEALGEAGVAAVGAYSHAPSPGTWVQRAYDAFRPHLPGRHDVTWLGSGNLAVARDAFTAMGGFDASLDTCEDVDFCQHLRAAGHRIICDSRLHSVHYGDPATLRQLFLGELWRGRDNLRASLRLRPTLREWPSIIIPVLDLALMIAVVGGLAAATPAGAGLSGAAALGLLALSILRTARMLHHMGAASAADVVRAFAVAAVYDMARALALVWMAPYDARRREVEV